MARIWVSRRWCSFQCPQCHAAIGHSEPKIAVVTPTHVYLLPSHADGPFGSRRPDCVAGVGGFELRNPCASHVFEMS
jgi:hypothetical protein